LGERLEYSVRYFGISVGTVAIEVARLLENEGRRLAHVVATARTNDFFSAFYPIDDRSEAWIDIDRLVTVRTATHTHHGRKRETYEEVTFDWSTHFLHVMEAKRHRGRVHDLVLDFGPFVYDTFDIFYAVRRLPLAPGYAVDLPVYASKKVYGFGVEIDRVERIRSRLLGEVVTLVLRPYDTLDGERQGDGAGEIWLLADGSHVPVRLKGWFNTNESYRVGSLIAELVAYERGEAVEPRRKVPWDAPRARVARSAEGMPIWEPPAAIRAARRAARTVPVDRRIPIAWPDAVGCVGRPPRRAPPFPVPAGS
jgi:hypothetical protein